MATLLCQLHSAHSFASCLGKNLFNVIHVPTSVFVTYPFSLVFRNDFLTALLISLLRDGVLLAYLASLLGCDTVQSDRSVATLRNNALPQSAGYFNPLTPELNPSAQRCLTRFFTDILLLEPCISLIYSIDCSSIEHLSEGTRNAT
jgi:hypothetical protein